VSSAASVWLDAEVEGYRRDPAMTVWEWADLRRILSNVASAEPGRWRTDRTPYLREPMEALSVTSDILKVVMQTGAQLGKTETGNNWLGSIIDMTPGPTLMVQPTVETAKRTSKQRIAPMIESSPSLREKVAAARERDSGNTVLMKEFRGGLLIITGANSGAGLRSMPIRNLFLDEVDEYPGDVDGQGDPVALAEKRTATFPRRKILMTSTPTVKGTSRIESEFLQTDMRRYYVPCPDCGHMDWMRWENIRWTPNQPETAALACTSCGVLIDERNKTKMLARGEWRATRESNNPRIRGYHLSSLYSPLGWKSWQECVEEFLAAKHDASKLKTWVNTVLGETWEERGDSVEAGTLRARAETYAEQVPHGVGVLVASIDVQSDRLEVAVKGYGIGEESWLVHFEMLWGDPLQAALWTSLDAVLAQPFKHESGRIVRIERAVIDSGGLNTEEVYRYCKVRQRAGVPVFGEPSSADVRTYPLSIMPIKGGGMKGRPLIERPSRTNRYALPLFVLCVDTGKDTVLGRLLINVPGPGYCHIPKAEWCDDEYLEQLTSERAVRKFVKGRGWVREWVPLRERNEAFDLEVYSLAALYSMGTTFLRALPQRVTAWSTPPPEGGGDAGPVPGAPPAPRRPTPRRPGRGWVGGWRK
jgi:phage terminase large subunit GpA-like protein